jgi:hypothetical protein
MLHEAINWNFSEFSPSTGSAFSSMAQFIRSLSHPGRGRAQGSINLTVFVDCSRERKRGQNMKRELRFASSEDFTVSSYLAVQFGRKESRLKGATMLQLSIRSDMAGGRLPLFAALPYRYFPSQLPLTFSISCKKTASLLTSTSLFRLSTLNAPRSPVIS